MLFPTVEFAIFFPAVLVISWALMPRPALWKPFVLAVSYLFYASASWKFCLLLGGVTLGNQAAARLIEAQRAKPRRAKQIMGAAVALDLAVLGVFKYYGFFSQDINDFLDSLGLGLPVPLATIALPVGISFYVFQAISYTVDVWRGLIKPAKAIDFGIYLAFFPHLVAGPIVRARELIPQLATPRNPRDVPVATAVLLICSGLIKKVAIADYLARAIVDPVFGVPEAFHTPDVLLAAYAYAAQIYCDFSGYTDIAIGLALLMGFVFPQNFNKPYRSRSFQEFWTRWHITLSRFLRDFLYIPLGGNHGGKLFIYRNLMLTMLLGGLWHGAAWTFVIWGGIHGTALVVERIARDRVRWSPPEWLKWLVTFHVVVLAWIMFRSPDLDIAKAFLDHLFSPGAQTLWTPTVVAVVIGVIGIQLLPEGGLQRLRIRMSRLHPAALGAALALVIAFVGATEPSQGVAPFIYFRF
jgi:alginate O-acetyltransferase complex protein AlgI